MKKTALHQWTVFTAAAWLLVIAAAGCTDRSGAGDPASRIEERASVSDEGRTIIFPAHSPGLRQIATTVVKRGTALVSVVAPARVVASISQPPYGGTDKMILFESADVTSLYSQYRQSRTNLDRATKNLTRVRDMFENHAATAKDVTDAETDAANARSSFAEFEGKLRTAGFSPPELENAKAGSIWLISDVTETQLHDVDKGEDVDITFSAFPGRKLNGKAEAVGEVVDPVTRTVRVRVSAPNLEGKVLPGMFARVDFGDPVSNVFALLPSAIATVEGKDYVFVESQPGEFHRREVLIQYSSADQIVLRTGIENGEHVVTSGTILLKGLSFGY
jgi:cobalt-zinc-cadmium efflux system membrane fusion protein